MTTLATMKTRIEDETGRADLPAQIENAINEAIGYYQTQRFYWNERNDVEFQAVATQAAYAASDQPYIPVAYDVDDVFVTVSGNEYRIKRMDPTRWRLLNNASTQGQPYQYSYFNRTVYLYPVPDQEYQIRMVGQFRIDAPASDAESDNPWMTDAETLIRHRAKMLLFRDVLMEAEKAMLCAKAEMDALYSLRAVTSSMTRTGLIEPMQF